MKATSWLAVVTVVVTTMVQQGVALVAEVGWAVVGFVDRGWLGGGGVGD